MRQACLVENWPVRALRGTAALHSGGWCFYMPTVMHASVNSGSLSLLMLGLHWFIDGVFSRHGSVTKSRDDNSPGVNVSVL